MEVQSVRKVEATGIRMAQAIAKLRKSGLTVTDEHKRVARYAM
jgi:hypothetical protein